MNFCDKGNLIKNNIYHEKNEKDYVVSEKNYIKSIEILIKLFWLS